LTTIHNPGMSGGAVPKKVRSAVSRRALAGARNLGCWDKSPALLDGVCSDDMLQRFVSDVSANLTFGQRGSYPASTNEPHTMACMNQGSNAACQAYQVHPHGYFARCPLCVCRCTDDWRTTDGSQIETLYDGCAFLSEVDSSPLNYSCYVHPALLQHARIETLITKGDSCLIKAHRVCVSLGRKITPWTTVWTTVTMKYWQWLHSSWY
jgi:hypothetical protein